MASGGVCKNSKIRRSFNAVPQAKFKEPRKITTAPDMYGVYSVSNAYIVLRRFTRLMLGGTNQARAPWVLTCYRTHKYTSLSVFGLCELCFWWGVWCSSDISTSHPTSRCIPAPGMHRVFTVSKYMPKAFSRCLARWSGSNPTGDYFLIDRTTCTSLSSGKRFS